MEHSKNIINKFPRISDFLSHNKNYWAHLPFTKTQKEETLSEHCELTAFYLTELIQNNKLDETIDNLIVGVSSLEKSENYLNEIKNLFLISIVYHDLGKVIDNFQSVKMKNPHFKKSDCIFEANHSLPGAYLFVLKQLDRIWKSNFEEDEKIIILSMAILFSHSVEMHHHSKLDNARERIIETELLLKLEGLKKYLRIYSVEFDEIIITHIFNNIKDLFLEFENQTINNEFEKFALIKLHFSLLTASDFLATSHYMNDWQKPITDFGILTTKLKNKIIEKIKTTKSFNAETYRNIDNYKFLFPKEKGYDQLNRLRQELSIEVIKNINIHKDKNLFYIEAPTGSGKTNLSMLATAELLNADKENNKINQVFYVFPFTTLITQTYQALIETFDLTENEIIQLHSKSGFTEKDDNYGLDKQNYIDYLFIYYPIILLSHVKFFDILKTNKKEENYLVHRISNSIVIIDEIQAYNPNEWDKIIYFINNYSIYFNIKFIIMSATLPKLGKLANSKAEFCYLVENKNDYFTNPNFKERVNFDYSLLKWSTPNGSEEKEIYLKNLAEFLFEKSQNYCTENSKYPDSVYTLIEFIYKKTATQFYQIINEVNNNFFDEIFVLSGTILEPRRKEIISFLKNEENRSKRILVITTQVVEAGVDIDMDLGFKDQSLIDSDEQLAGRINRNVNKTDCKLFLFKLDDAKVIYGNDDRYKIIQKELNHLYTEILETKDFDKLYNEVFKKINKWNNSTLTKGFSDYKLLLEKLNFEKIDWEFRLIQSSSTSIFVPIEIPISVSFSKNEIQFLINYGIIKEFDNIIEGEQVWNFFEKLIKLRNNDFIQNRIEMKKIQGIMSKFIFSMYTYSKDIERLKQHGYVEEKYGFLYLHHHRKIYDYKFGIDDNKFEETIFL
jgi:CRISPR-associated endonuclease/helicase Cas3